MPEHDWTSGTPTATQFQTELMQQAIIKCTASTRGTAYVGKHIYETDTDRHMYSADGSTYQLLVPRYVRSVSLTTTGPAGSHTDYVAVNGSDMTLTTASNTRYMVFYQFAVTSSGSGDPFTFRLFRDSTQLWQSDYYYLDLGTPLYPLLQFQVLDTPGSGSHTYSMQVTHPSSNSWSITAGAHAFGYVQQFSGT